MSHAEMYLKLLDLTCRADTRDSSYHAAFYLLSADAKVFEKARYCVSSTGVDFATIKSTISEMHDTQRQLVDIAHNLFSWNSNCAVTPFDVSRLGYPLLDLVCTAFYVANGMTSLSVTNNAFTLDKSGYERIRKIKSFFEDLTSSALADSDIVT